jgi:hypothetical protein
MADGRAANRPARLPLAPISSGKPLSHPDCLMPPKCLIERLMRRGAQLCLLETTVQ